MTLLIHSQNDCALLITEDGTRLLQTTLGWLFREISTSFGEFAAVQYFYRLVHWDVEQSTSLRKALGPSYDMKYEVFLRYIRPQELGNIAFLAEGRHGRVLSTSWNRTNELFESQEKSPTLVVLKHVLGEKKENVGYPDLKTLEEVSFTLETVN
jgi:hypothetical protein